MAITNYTDFVIDNQYFHTGMFEGVTQNLGLFNEVSSGAVRLTDDRYAGHYNDRLLYKTMEDAWTRRDITAQTAVSSADTKKVEEISQRGVKFNAKMYSPFVLHAFQKNFDPGMKGDYQEISRKIGQATAVGRLKQQVNHALYASRAALKNQSTSLYSNATSAGNYSGKMNSGDLGLSRAKLGDASGKLRCWIMHSKVYFDLVGNQVADKVTGVSDFILREGTGLTYNIPVLIIDSPALTAVIGSGSAAYTEYYTLGLVEDAVVIANSEPEVMVAEVVTGAENLRIDLQGEGAHNIEVKGFQWDTSNGGINPTEAALATGSNWDLASAHVKNRAGLVIASR